VKSLSIGFLLSESSVFSHESGNVSRRIEVNYFITGATGIIGSRVADRLLAEGHTLRVLVRDEAKAKSLRERGACITVGDLSDIESLREGMLGADGVFHITGWYKTGVRDASAASRINIEGTRNVLQVMKELAVPKGVYTSTLAFNSNTKGRLVDESYRYEGPHLSEYDRTKWVAHRRTAAHIGGSF
jgi:nucleoside-diphosphate-sugar epimerase